jgi:hypothetical protein
MSFFNVKILQECEKNEKKYFHKLPYLLKKNLQMLKKPSWIYSPIKILKK